jgi:hypothetical protein
MKRINKIIPLIIVWLILTSTAPFIFYVWPGHPYKLLTFSGLLLMIIFFVYKNRKQLLLDRNILIIIIVQICYYLFVTSIYHNFSNINLCIQFVALFIIISFIHNFIGFEGFVKSYIYIILIMGIGGVLAFLIHLLIGLPPIFEVKYTTKGITYFLGLTSTNSYYNIGNLRIVRYAGFFDEPGAFGLYSLFAIILNKMYFDNRKIEKYLIIVTSFTFSLAFFVIILAYLILFYFKLSYLKYSIIPFILVAAFYFGMSKYAGKNESLIMLKEITVDRIKQNAKGKIYGDNRTSASLHDKMLFLKHPVLGVQVEGQVRGSNLYAIFSKYGLLGSVFYYAFLVYFFVQILKLRGEMQLTFLKLFLIIIVNFFHRPEFSAVFTLLIIYSMITYLDSYSKEPSSNILATY